MFGHKLILLALVTAAATEQVVPSCSGECSSDDATVLLQNKVEVHLKPGVSDVTGDVDASFDEFWTEFNSESVQRGANAEYYAMMLFVFIGCGSAAALAYPNSSKQQEMLLPKYNQKKEEYAKLYKDWDEKKWENIDPADEALKAEVYKKKALEWEVQDLSSKVHAGEGAWKLHVSLAFGLTITVLVYAIGHISGGHINWAVTYGLYKAGQISWARAMAYLWAQLQGAIVGAALVWVVFGRGNDRTDSLGCNAVSPNYSFMSSFVGEVIGTFLLVFVVLETAVDKGNKAERVVAAIAIGLAVFLAHTFLIPVDGCSINPTRSSGPPLLAIFQPILDWMFKFLNLAIDVLRAIPDIAMGGDGGIGDSVGGGSKTDGEAKEKGFGEKLSAFCTKTSTDMSTHFYSIKDLYNKDKLLGFLNIFSGLVFFWIAPCLGAAMAAETWKSLKA